MRKLTLAGLVGNVAQEKCRAQGGLLIRRVRSLQAAGSTYRSCTVQHCTARMADAQRVRAVRWSREQGGDKASGIDGRCAGDKHTHTLAHCLQERMGWCEVRTSCIRHATVDVLRLGKRKRKNQNKIGTLRLARFPGCMHGPSPTHQRPNAPAHQRTSASVGAQSTGADLPDGLQAVYSVSRIHTRLRSPPTLHHPVESVRNHVAPQVRRCQVCLPHGL